MNEWGQTLSYKANYNYNNWQKLAWIWSKHEGQNFKLPKKKW